MSSTSKGIVTWKFCDHLNGRALLDVVKLWRVQTEICLPKAACTLF